MVFPRAGSIAAVVAVVSALGGCREPTQVTMTLTTDATCGGSGFREAVITVGAPAAMGDRDPGATTGRCHEGAPESDIGTVVLVPSGDDDEPFAVRVVAGIGVNATECPAPDFVLDEAATAEGRGCIVSRRILGFVPHTPLRLPVVLRTSCLNVRCGGVETCVSGKCVSAIVDPNDCTGPDGCPETSLGGGSSTGGGGAGGGGAGGGGAGGGGTGGGGAGGGGAGGGGAGSGVIDDIAVGPTYSCAVRGGEVFCWGADLYGEWGEGTKSSTAALPHKVMDNIRDVVEVAPGERHMCVRTGSGQIYCAGDGNQGQLGLFPNSESLVPVEIADMSVTSFSRVESGQHHTCAIPSSGQTGVVCWGSNESAQIESPGGGVSPPSLRHQTLTLGDVSAGDRHTCARTVAGEAYCWGANNRLQSGGSGGMAPVGLTVVELGNVAPVTAVTTGSEHSCALDGAGNLYCWGASDKGQRGGNFNDSATGVQVSLPPVSVPILSASADMTCAVTGPDAASELFCWGVFGDTWGADGSTGPSVVSLDTIPSPYLDVAAGDNHACAVVDGMGEPQIYCWGYEDVSGAVTGVSNPMGAFVPPTLVALP